MGTVRLRKMQVEKKNLKQQISPTMKLKSVLNERDKQELESFAPPQRAFFMALYTLQLFYILFVLHLNYIALQGNKDPCICLSCSLCTFISNVISHFTGTAAQMQYYSTHSAAILWLVLVLRLNTTISVYLLPPRFSILSKFREGKVTNSYCLILTARKILENICCFPSLLISTPKHLGTQGHQELTSGNQGKSLQHPFITERKLKQKKEVLSLIVTACQCWNPSSPMRSLKEISPESSYLFVF